MCWRWPCSPCVCGSRPSTGRMRGMADGLETERRKVAELQMVIGRRANAARSYGNRGRAAAPAPGLRPRLQRRPSLPLRLVRPCRREGRRLRCQWRPRWRFRASAKRRSGLRGRSFGRSASRPCAPARPGRQRLDAQQHPDAGAVGGGCLGAGRPGRAATHCGARSQDVTQGSPRGGARLRGPRGLPNWRLARPVAPRRPPRPSALSGRPRPARQQLLRTSPQPAVLLRAFPPRPRASRRCSRLTVLPSGARARHAR